jgi:uncharacterized protein (TIGR04255 family)
MGRLYETPPLIEAICEFRFEPSQPWDWTIPGLVYDKIRTDFPKKRQQNLMQLEFQIDPHQKTQELKGGIARMQFLREDERALIQVGPDLLAVNHLKPYPSWKAFKQLIVNALSVYQGIAEPKGFRRMGLRYINRIEIPETQVRIEDYLLAVPQVPEPVPQVFATWLQRIEIPFEQANGVLVLQSGNPHEPDQTGVSFILDLDFFTLRPAKIALDSAMEWVERAHEETETTFEVCITDKSRTLFKEVKETASHA